MLYLITGKPGSGKTLHMVSMLLKRKDLQNRPLYIDGIPDVDVSKIPHEKLPENCTGENWHEWLPTNAILVVDECQRYWRQRPNGSKVPEAVQAIETHRHRGVDLFFITQHPRLIDMNIKSFVENHKHFDKTQLGTRRMWEWQRCGNPDNKGDIADAMAKPYTLDKSAFDAYKSAELHTKIKVNRSFWFWLFPLIVVAAIAMTVYALSYNKQILFEQPKKAAETAAVAASQPTKADGEAQAAPSDVGGGRIAVASEPVPNDDQIKAMDFKPNIDGKPWTAPIYHPMNKQVKTMPYPVACVKNGSRCTCYTEQATPIHGLDKGICLDFVENGIYNPYLQNEQQAQVRQSENPTK
ncbi:zonular occludens toxin domain-containing protein [Alysiella filiformis]|uniref:Zona occludens toxin n=1 Tax=Alysiella filiformis DSM 16848 TaxID=1120981 RepID=A0A286E9Q6_9NEIS|nr:zonular occludens toxin domain-containing protein [Alysiella filiformis]QMT31390.1 zonular occludens toxin family protein [Alysiella filiformis]UBQ55601.1 zonular occludens toxin domain-containing protein [Alysiella filiformis DSM 16848]SOD67619.1 zona occludens toxin [Alysiella filiformis DSM 16848]